MFGRMLAAPLDYTAQTEVATIAGIVIVVAVLALYAGVILALDWLDSHQRRRRHDGRTGGDA